ncbi:MAG: hypothetical protein S4CHLAM81_03360 [Chlamydiales bacterium]|nr:hypothetical protein [Chlamydiales bacterium]MCH9635126.1 hypothetical protein [Chlamydiales bacterium]MCH9703344.1 hypothetical protein [Chlamydiota bacterium]
MKKALFLSLILVITACTDPSAMVTSINIIDRNGMSETISSKERLAAFEKTDFMAPQPYQKVLRVYGRTKSGDISSQITSYHPNGQIKQYLESVNSRARGDYREWHPNGHLKVEAYVIGGVADLNTQAEQSWLFEGKSLAYDDEGRLEAEILYSKGDLEGVATYYHSNGKTWKLCPYKKGVLDGTLKIFLADGTLFQTTEFVEGKKSGSSIRYWDLSHVAYLEKYESGRLMEASYYDQAGRSVASIEKGEGKRAIFNKVGIDRLESFKNGVQEGAVSVFDEQGSLVRSYTVVEGQKQGEEIDFFPGTEMPKLLMSWNQGLLQGSVKSWYPNGQLESQREMCQNQKYGLLTAWYEDGAVMLLEEYEADLLVKGEYFRKGESDPVTRVENGSGMATLFSADGSLSHRICYDNGRPLN